MTFKFWYTGSDVPVFIVVLEIEPCVCAFVATVCGPATVAKTLVAVVAATDTYVIVCVFVADPPVPPYVAAPRGNFW